MFADFRIAQIQGKMNYRNSLNDLIKEGEQAFGTLQ